jgi:hypothetical protein
LFYPDGTPVYNVGLRGYLPSMDESDGTRTVRLFSLSSGFRACCHILQIR